MSIIGTIKSALGGQPEMPTGAAFPSTWFTRKGLALDRLGDQIRTLRLHRAPVPAETQARFDALTAEVNAGRAHNDAIEAAHAATCNAVKAKMRRANKVQFVGDEDI
jgi:hypothetical protein